MEDARVVRATGLGMCRCGRQGEMQLPKGNTAFSRFFDESKIDARMTKKRADKDKILFLSMF